MADEMDDAVRSLSGPDSRAARLALDAAMAGDAADYLKKLSRLTDLQIENLQKLDEYETSHLRWRRFNDQMKGAMQIMLVLVGALIVFGIAAAMWNASQADGLVVDSFAVPPGNVQAGLTGSVVADDMTQKIAAIHDFANGYSLAHSKDVREARDQDVKVEIPETGISISEAWRYLRLWLGNEQHLNGNLRALPDGKIGLTASLGGSDTFAFVGKPDDLDNLEQKAAERVFATIDPINYVLYLSGKDRNTETLAAAAHNLSLWTGNRDLAEAYALYADMTHVITGDVRLALARTNLAMALDPRSTPPHMERLHASQDLGHDEDVFEQAREIAGLRQEDNVGSWRTGNGYPYVQQLGAISRATESGDFANLSTLPCLVYCSLAFTASLHAEGFARLHDAAHASELIAQAQSCGATDAAGLVRTQYFIHAATGDWRASVIDARRFANALRTDRSVSARLESLRVQTQAMPLLAQSLARSGDFAAARKAIDATPADCYLCLRERGNIDALKRNRAGAAWWFARAVNAAPSIPFAYADWGEMLLRNGAYNGAIAKFTLANRNGPRFADPLEMWGEALMAKNRSDLALAKFEEANKYAPNWGRLHLKWGEALEYANKKDEAKMQFVIAASLDLSSSDKAALTNWQRSGT